MVEVKLRVVRINAREAPKASLDSGTVVVHEHHRLEVGRAAVIHLVGLVCEAALPEQHVVGPLAVVNGGVVPRDVRPMRLWGLNAAGIREGVQRTHEEGQPEA